MATSITPGEFLPAVPGADIWLTPEKAAQHIGFSKGTLAIWRSTREVDIPFATVNGSIRYKLSDLDAFMAERMSGGPLHRQRPGGPGRPKASAKKKRK